MADIAETAEYWNQDDPGAGEMYSDWIKTPITPEDDDDSYEFNEHNKWKVLRERLNKLAQGFLDKGLIKKYSLIQVVLIEMDKIEEEYL